MTQNQIKLAVVISHPIQHYTPVYRQLAQDKRIQLMVFFIAENGVQHYFDDQFKASVKWDIDLLNGYSHCFVEPNNVIQSFAFNDVDSDRLVPELAKFRPDLVWLHGYAQRANWRAMRWVKQNQSLTQQPKILFSSDSNLSDRRAWYKKIIKQGVVRYFYRQCDRFLSIGNHNSLYLQHYGVKPEQIQSAHFPIDMQRLIQLRDQLSKDSSRQLRDRFAIPEQASLVLFVGKLIAHKRPQDIIDALATLDSQLLSGSQLYVLYVGSGDMQTQLEALVQQYKLQQRVKFAGFVNQSQLADYFNSADMLVMCSEKEPYGAVVSEALPFSLPLVVSDQVGAIGSSAIDHSNAIVYKCGDVVQLAKAMLCIVNDTVLYQSMGQASLQQVELHDARQFAQAVSTACISLVNKASN